MLVPKTTIYKHNSSTARRHNIGPFEQISIMCTESHPDTVQKGSNNQFTLCVLLANAGHRETSLSLTNDISHGLAAYFGRLERFVLLSYALQEGSIEAGVRSSQELTQVRKHRKLVRSLLGCTSGELFLSQSKLGTARTREVARLVWKSDTY